MSMMNVNSVTEREQYASQSPYIANHDRANSSMQHSTVRVGEDPYMQHSSEYDIEPSQQV